MKYQGQVIDLNDDGKIECSELGIVGDTVDDVKKAIREATKKEAALPKIKIIYFGGWGNSGELKEGTTTAKAEIGSYGGTAYVWVTSGKKREKKSSREIYLDTPENRDIVTRYLELLDQAEKLNEQAGDLRDTLKTVTPILPE